MAGYHPIFIDFEASSLSQDSYPIEFAWGSDSEEILSFLISPQEIPHWTDWNDDAERVHGITRDLLMENGMEVRKACHTIFEALNGSIVYCDAPAYDSYWFSELFKAANFRLPRVEIKHIDELLFQILNPYFKNTKLLYNELDHIKYLARLNRPQQHRAAWDVDYLLHIYELSQQQIAHKSAH